MSDLRTAWEGKAGQVRIGHLIQGNRQTLDDIWEVVEMKNPAQIEYGHTLWWRVVNVTTGVVAAIPPKVLTQKVRFMLTDEEHADAERLRRPPDRARQWPVDSDEVLELVVGLGAEHIASRDNLTGEITCPSYADMFGPIGAKGIPEVEHLRLAHGLDVSGLEAIVDWEEKYVAIIAAHGELHGPESSRRAHKGFPHRHVPEDHSIL